MLPTIILFFIIFLLIVFFIEMIRRYYFRNKKTKQTITEETPIKKEEEECCGLHEICEKNNLLKALNKNIEYYDDEELDIYRRRCSDSYSDAEVEEFREILYTMLEKDVPGWVNSLKTREIDLPDQLKDEIFLIIKNQ